MRLFDSRDVIRTALSFSLVRAVLAKDSKDKSSHSGLFYIVVGAASFAFCCLFTCICWCICMAMIKNSSVSLSYPIKLNSANDNDDLSIEEDYRHNKSRIP